MAVYVADPRLETALTCFQQGRGEEALALAGSVFDEHPDSANVPLLIGQMMARLGQPLAALEVLLKASEKHPAERALLLELGMVYQILGRIHDAAECYRQCTSLFPKDGYVRELHSQMLLEQWLFAMTGRRIGREASKSFSAKVHSGFFKTYLSGNHILDIGYRGGFGEAEPIVPQAIGIDLGYPGYDGVHLPFPDNSQDAIYTSHCLEHMDQLHAVMREWLRVLRIGGYAVIVVPHQYLYERKAVLPSDHPGHKHFFTPAKLLALVEDALPANHYRVRHLADNDLFYDYSLTPDTHPVGCYEIELVLEKMQAPSWTLKE
ncbi:methyltransferase domain-containing protein [Azospirillum sp. TSO22-1]|uniref:methyltransferase domain-containing protein n=1 Tax=Azospirillum sp. TSO22-1 TaxID=716789 RepID=UPI000D65A734|nr:methyltransferase domain-containing protein [Azospirillum sp. TSO22-1]